MIKINSLPKIIKKRKKRLGQGLGSGKGKTAGKGTKGQRSRGIIKARNSIRNSSYIRRLPLYRGKYRNKPIGDKPLIVNIKHLNSLEKNSVVNIELLIKSGILEKEAATKFKVKILGDGQLSVPLIIALPCSKSAAKKIEKAGGKVISTDSIIEEKLRITKK